MSYISYIHTLHYITLHYITLHHITSHHITLHTYTHYITLHYKTLHYIHYKHKYIRTYIHTYIHMYICTIVQTWGPFPIWIAYTMKVFWLTPRKPDETWVTHRPNKT